MDDVTSRNPSVVAATADAATLPSESATSTLPAARLAVTIDEAPPVMADVPFALSCSCSDDVTSSRYPSVVAVTVEAATFPPPSATSTLPGAKLALAIDDAAPVITLCLASSWSCTLARTPATNPNSVVVTGPDCRYRLSSTTSGLPAVGTPARDSACSPPW